jgi:type I restriction enzyme R subunit
MATNQDFAGVLLDNEALRAELLAVYTPTIYARAKVAGQRTCPIGELIRSDGESMWLEYKSTLRWDVRKAVKAGYIEDATVKTIAGFANAPFGGTLLVGVADDGTVHGLEDDYATFSKRGERGDRDLWGQHLHNLLGRLGQAATPLVEWEFLSIAGRDIARINVSPSDFPVYETRGDKRTFWQRTPIGTEAVIDPADVEKIIARRWGK